MKSYSVVAWIQACCLLSCFIYAQADEVQTIPVEPKGTRIDFVNPSAPRQDAQTVKMLVTDPAVENKLKKHRPDSEGKPDRRRSRKSPDELAVARVTPSLEVKQLPIAESAVHVKNNSANFLFVDITDRQTDRALSSGQWATLEMRRLQVEAVRQAAATVKGK